MGKSKRLRNQGTRAETVAYWHGGTAGRAVGEVLVPGLQVPGYGSVLAGITGSKKRFRDYRPDYVYVTTDRDLAFDFAVRHLTLGLDSALYRVFPQGKPSHDPDYPVGVSFRCRSANVLAVEPDIFDASSVESGAARKYMTWDDGTPLYDLEGYALPNQLQHHFGMRPQHLRSLGKAAEFPLIHRRCSEVLQQLVPGFSQAHVDRYFQLTNRTRP